MRRSLSAKVAVILFVVATSTVPVYAAPRSRDGAGVIERAIARLVQHIRTILEVPVIQIPGG
jgi:hypothetical protein